VDDRFLRAMLWGALWDQVRAYRMPPERFVRLGVQALPRERDEQIVPVLVARLGRAVEAYLWPEARRGLQLEGEQVLRRGADDSTLPYGVRKAYSDGFVGLASSPAGVVAVDSLLDTDSVAGEPLRDPTLGRRHPPARAGRRLGRATPDSAGAEGHHPGRTPANIHRGGGTAKPADQT